MASTAYARIGGRGKSELRAVGLLRLSLCLGSSLISIPKLENPNATGIRSTKREDRFLPSLPASFAKRNTAKQYGESENRFGCSPETILGRTHRPRRRDLRFEYLFDVVACFLLALQLVVGCTTLIILKIWKRQLRLVSIETFAFCASSRAKKNKRLV